MVAEMILSEKSAYICKTIVESRKAIIEKSQGVRIPAEYLFFLCTVETDTLSIGWRTLGQGSPTILSRSSLTLSPSLCLQIFPCSISFNAGASAFSYIAAFTL